MEKKKKINYFLIVFRLIVIVIILVCLYNIFVWYKENKASEEMLGKVSNYVDKENTKTVTIADENEDETEDINLYNIDFNSLLAENNSTVGWIKVYNTNIDYPVVQHTDNDFYLTHSFNKSYNSAGWIFADYRNDMTNFDNNTVIYGHNRRNASMFSTLNNILEEYWYTNPENKYVYFYTPNGTMIYEIFSVYKIEAESYYLTTSFANNSEYLNFLDKLKNRSIYNFGIRLNENDKIITLSTCSSSNAYRTVLHAKLVYAD